MATHVTIHECENVRLSYMFKSGAIEVVVEHDGGKTEITLYDLPQHVVDKFEVFCDDDTVDCRHDDEEQAA